MKVWLAGYQNHKILKRKNNGFDNAFHETIDSERYQTKPTGVQTFERYCVCFCTLKHSSSEHSSKRVLPF